MKQLNHLIITHVLARRGRWMTSAEIAAAAPEYPAEEYVADDLERLVARGAVIAKAGSLKTLPRFGLPGWRR